MHTLCPLVVTRDDALFAVEFESGSDIQCRDSADSEGAYEHHTKSLQRCATK